MSAPPPAPAAATATPATSVPNAPAPAATAASATLAPNAPVPDASPSPKSASTNTTMEIEEPAGKEKEGDDNTRGIPPATFIDNVVEYVGTRGGAEPVLRELHNLYGKYKFMEGRLIGQKKSLLTKIPDITSALECLQTIVAKKATGKALTTTFQLSDAVFAKATIKPTVNSVMLWLGANVMLEYDFKEAEALLSSNLKNAHTNLGNLNKDLSFLKDQITVSEVNIARVHNYRVKLTQEAKRAAAAAAAAGAATTVATANKS